MPLKIVIPSHKRHDRVQSKGLVDNPILCVEESQKDVYKDHNPNVEIVTHPDSVYGLVEKRNWMAKHFGELFMIDDDVKYFYRNNYHVGMVRSPETKESTTLKINQLHELAKMMDIKLFGFSKNPRPEYYNVFNPIALNQMITGCAYGVIADTETIHWSNDIVLKEDFYISCYVKYKERKILVDNRFNFVQMDTFKNEGGLSGIRNNDKELENILKIKKFFGSSITLKKPQSNAKLAKKYNITASFKF